MVIEGLGLGGARRLRRAPDRGDVVWMDFDPQAGHEQRGRRPALVLSPLAYNQASGLMLCCPITSRAKGYPFEVPMLGATEVTGVVLSDQVRNLDWQARNADPAGTADEEVLDEVMAKIHALLS